MFSERRKHVPWRLIGIGIVLQFVLAAAFTKIPAFGAIFAVLNRAVGALNDATRAGTSFVFGYVGGGDVPWTGGGPGSPFVFGFQSLPLILIISALSALLFHWNIIPPVVKAFAWVLRRTLRVSGPVGMGVATTIFLGNVEAPLVIRPYLHRETRAGLFVIMTAGMAMVAGTVMVLYATILDGIIPNPIGQILSASILTAPAAIVIAFIMVPELPENLMPTSDSLNVALPVHADDNMISVIARGTLEGVQLLINIIAMLVVLVALVSLLNHLIAVLPDVGGAPLTLQRMFGWLMSPVAWMLGIPWSEAPTAGALLGTKAALNELIAYSDMARLPEGTLSPRSRLIMTYALCGFANFSSMGIMIGGLGAMVPERRAEIVALAPRTLISGTLATCLSGAVIGVLTWAA